MPKSTKKNSRKPSSLDRRCWNDWKRERKSFDEIATTRKMSVLAVGAAIQRVNDYRSLLNEEDVTLAINEFALQNISKVGQTIMQAQKATTTSYDRVGRDKYRKVTRPDHATRLKAAETFRAMFVEAVRPKGGGVNIALQQNNAGSPGGAVPSPQGHSFEERLRRIREERGIKDEADEIIQGEVVEGSSLHEELEDIGIELEDDDEENEDDEEGDDEDGEDE